MGHNHFDPVSLQIHYLLQSYIEELGTGTIIETFGEAPEGWEISRVYGSLSVCRTRNVVLTSTQSNESLKKQ
jgi:hypothetical protein